MPAANSSQAKNQIGASKYCFPFHDFPFTAKASVIFKGIAWALWHRLTPYQSHLPARIDMCYTATLDLLWGRALDIIDVSIGTQSSPTVLHHFFQSQSNAVWDCPETPASYSKAGCIRFRFQYFLEIFRWLNLEKLALQSWNLMNQSPFGFNFSVLAPTNIAASCDSRLQYACRHFFWEYALAKS